MEMEIDNSILPYENYIVIYKVSYISLIGAAYAYYKEQYTMIPVPGGVFLTSINYWRNPQECSWQRKLDMMYVKLSILYNIFRAYNAEYQNKYYITLFIAMLCYPISNYYYRKQRLWASTYWHCLLHIIANSANIILYSGDIDSISNNKLLS